MACRPAVQAALRRFTGRFLAAHRAESQEVQRNLWQLDALITDVVGRMSIHFERLSALSTLQHEMASAAPHDANGSAPVPQEAERLRKVHAVRQDVGDVLNELMVTLQFGDIASQLVKHTQTRAGILDRLAEQLVRLPDALADRTIGDLPVALELERRTPVSQMQMVRGSAELF